MSYLNGQWSGLSVHRKRKLIAMTALRKLAGFRGMAGDIARQALKDCQAVTIDKPKPQPPPPHSEKCECGNKFIPGIMGATCVFCGAPKQEPQGRE